MAEIVRPRQDKEACIKVFHEVEFESAYGMLKDWFTSERGWLFKGGDIAKDEIALKRMQTSSNPEGDVDKGQLVLKCAEEFVCSIDEALRDAFSVKARSNQGTQRVVWAIKLRPLINRVRKHFKFTEDESTISHDPDATCKEIAFCKAQKENSIVQGNKYNFRLPKGIVPVPLSDDIGDASRKWLLIPYTTGSFMDNLSEALCICRYKLEDCMANNTMTARYALRAENFIACAQTTQYVAAKIVFLQEMEPKVRAYLKNIGLEGNQ